MIEIEFKIKKREISQESIKDIFQAMKDINNEIIFITCFLMPTKFLIDGIDVFFNKKYPKLGPWRDMPLILWAACFLSEIKSLPKKKKTAFWFMHEGYSDILLEMQKNNKVKLTYMKTKNEFIVDYDELLKAFLKFEKEVKKFLNEYVPQLKEHPYWGDWVKGKVEYDEDKGLIPIKKK